MFGSDQTISFSDFLLQPEILDEDIDQEVALLRLSGKTKISRRIVRLRLLASKVEYLFWNELMDYEHIFNFRIIGHDIDDQPEIYDKVIEWASNYGIEAEQRIEEFFTNPSDEACEEIITFLETIGALSPREQTMSNKTKIRKEQRQEQGRIPGHHGTSLTSLLLRTFKKVGDSQQINDLYNLARQAHSSERPEAAVRTILRRLVKNGTLSHPEESTYTLIKPLVPTDL